MNLNRQRIHITPETKDYMLVHTNDRQEYQKVTLNVRPHNTYTLNHTIADADVQNRSRSTPKERLSSYKIRDLDQAHFKSELLQRRQEKSLNAKQAIYDSWRERIGDEPIMLPFMDRKHYEQILNHNHTNDAKIGSTVKQKLQFATIYVENNSETYTKVNPFRRPRHLTSNKANDARIEDSKLKAESLTVRFKKQPSPIQKKQQKQGKHSINLQFRPHKLNNTTQLPNQSRDGFSSSFRRYLLREKPNPVQRLRSRYEQLQQQVHSSGWQWMSKWLLGRRLALPK